MLQVRPISIAKANDFVAEHHRHHGRKTGCKFAVACYEDPVLHGVAICSNPVARNSDDGLTLEVSRLCTDGARNACSILYGACARIARDMGYKKIQTYILESENGASLRASGWIVDAEKAGAVNWRQCNSKRQNQRDEQPLQMTMFQRKKPPEEMKRRYAKYL